MLDYKKLRKEFSKLLKSHDRDSLIRLFEKDMEEETHSRYGASRKSFNRVGTT